MALVILRHGSAASLLPRQTGLVAIQRLDLTILIHRDHHGALGRMRDGAALDSKRARSQLVLAPPHTCVRVEDGIRCAEGIERVNVARAQGSFKTLRTHVA